MKANTLSEENQRLKFAQFYSSADKKLFFEIPVFGRSVDTVIHNLPDDTITAIEFKIRDWKRALHQVLNVSICFDFLAICIPTPKTVQGKKNVIKACSEIGVGLYFYNPIDETFEHTIVESKVSAIWEVQKKHVHEYLGGEHEWTKY